MKANATTPKLIITLSMMGLMMFLLGMIIGYFTDKLLIIPNLNWQLSSLEYKKKQELERIQKLIDREKEKGVDLKKELDRISQTRRGILIQKLTKKQQKLQKWYEKLGEVVDSNTRRQNRDKKRKEKEIMNLQMEIDRLIKDGQELLNLNVESATSSEVLQSKLEIERRENACLDDETVHINLQIREVEKRCLSLQESITDLENEMARKKAISIRSDLGPCTSLVPWVSQQPQHDDFTNVKIEYLKDNPDLKQFFKIPDESPLKSFYNMAYPVVEASLRRAIKADPDRFKDLSDYAANHLIGIIILCAHSGCYGSLILNEISKNIDRALRFGTLCLSNSKIVEIPAIEALNLFKHLYEIQMNNCKLCNENMFEGDWPFLKKITILSLEGNRFKDIPNFSCLPRLEVVHLGNCKKLKADPTTFKDKLPKGIEERPVPSKLSFTLFITLENTAMDEKAAAELVGTIGNKVPYIVGTRLQSQCFSNKSIT